MTTSVALATGDAVKAPGRRLRLAVVASHPVQYQAPWYRALSAMVDLRVFFAHRITAADHARAGFGVEFEWDTPLLEGYAFEWLENVSVSPSLDRFRGCDTPAIRTVLVKEAYDAVVVNGWHLLSYWQAIRAARRAGIPVLVRGDSQLVSSRGQLRRAVKRVVYPYLLRSFETCLAVGQRNADYYREYGVPPERIGCSPHCVDNDFFRRSAESARRNRGDLRRTLGIPESVVVFLFVGKLIDKKRPMDFLTALESVRRQHADVWGMVVGDGALRAEAEAYRARHAVPCTMTGFLNQQQIARAYAAADALILPSTGGETWGLVVNEAMASGIPAIVSDQVGCAPDLIVEGETGFTYPCGDVAALADRMSRLATNARLRTAMGTRARRHIADFSPEAAAAGVVGAIERLRIRPGHARENEGRHVVDAVS